MKTRQFAVVIGIMMILYCLVAIGDVGEGWDAIPKEMKTTITITDFTGRIGSSVSMFAGTEEAYEAFYGGSAIAEFCETYCWPGYEHVWVHVYAVSRGAGAFWAPWLISFTQGRRQYDVKGLGFELKEELMVLKVLLGQPWDYMAIEGPFGGGSLKPGISCTGAIRIPSEIDLTQPFKIWICNEFGVIEAFYGVNEDMTP